MDPNQIVASYENEIAELAARAEEAKDRIAHIAGTATSPDGAVTVTVNGGGALRDVSFGDRAEHLPRAQLAAAIMATARRAQAQASRQILAIMGPLVGEDSDAMRFVQGQIPSPEEPVEELPKSYPGQQALDDEPAGEPTLPPRPIRRPAPADDDDYALHSPLSKEETW